MVAPHPPRASSGARNPTPLARTDGPLTAANPAHFSVCLGPEFPSRPQPNLRSDRTRFARLIPVVSFADLEAVSLGGP